jgi:hypothetical protein
VFFFFFLIKWGFIKYLNKELDNIGGVGIILPHPLTSRTVGEDSGNILCGQFNMECGALKAGWNAWDSIEMGEGGNKPQLKELL